MRNINLLPWRERERKAYRQRFYIKSVCCTLLVTGVLFANAMHDVGKINTQESRNARLDQEIKKLDQTLAEYTKKQKQVDQLTNYISELSNLTQKTKRVSELLRLLPTFISNGVVLDKVTFENGITTLEGQAQSNAELASLVATLEKHEKITNVRIHSIINQEKSAQALNNTFVTTFEFLG